MKKVIYSGWIQLHLRFSRFSALNVVEVKKVKRLENYNPMIKT
jgi:hypothetical protein